MKETARYCTECLNKLAPGTAITPEDCEILKAQEFEPGTQPDYDNGPKTEEGICSKCSKNAIVTYYKISN